MEEDNPETEEVEEEEAEEAEESDPYECKVCEIRVVPEHRLTEEGRAAGEIATANLCDECGGIVCEDHCHFISIDREEQKSVCTGCWDSVHFFAGVDAPPVAAAGGSTGPPCKYCGSFSDHTTDKCSVVKRVQTTRHLRKLRDEQAERDQILKTLENDEGVRHALEVDEVIERCSVCMDRTPTVTINPCGHRILCRVCFTGVMRTKRECPICREPIEGEDTGGAALMLNHLVF